MTQPGTDRRLSDPERALFRRTFYEKNMAAFSAILWKNMVLAAARSPQPRETAQLLAWEMLINPAMASVLKPRALLDDAPEAFRLRYGDALTAAYPNGFAPAEKETALQIVAERFQTCGTDEVLRLLERWAELCAANETHSGYMKLKFCILNGGPLARAMRAQLPPDFDVDAVLAPVIAARNDWTHHAGEYYAGMTVARAQFMLRMQREAAAQFRVQADPEAFRAACDACESYCAQLLHAPFRLEELRRQLRSYDAVAPFVRAWMVRAYTEGELICFTDQAKLAADVNALSDELPRSGLDGSAVTSMRSGSLDYLAAAEGRALRPEDVRQLVERCTLFALPSAWLDSAGAAFLGTTCVKLLRAQSERRELRRALLMDNQTHRILRASEEQGRDEARSAGTRRRWMVREGDLEILPALPGVESPEDGIRFLAGALPDTRFCVFMTGSDIRFAMRLAESDLGNIIPVIIGKAGSPRAGQLEIIAPVWQTALRCITGADDPVPPEPPTQIDRGAPPEPVPEPRALPEVPAVWQPERAYRAPTRLPVSDSTVFTASGVPVRLGRVLGSGGEGTIYAVGRSNRAAKIYHETRNTPERYAKLDWMIRNDPKLDQLCWPEDLLWNAEGAFVGFLMLRVPDGALPFRTTVADMGKPSKNAQIMPRWDRCSLAVLCEAVCGVLARFPQGVLMGDVNPMNFLLDVQDDSFTRFWIVDCDSFQIAHWPCPVGTAEYTAPQIYAREGDNPRYSEFLRTPEDEAFAVSTLLFKILVGASPYSAIGKSDMILAIRERAFVYVAADSDPDGPGGRDVPDGPYRLIWRNMPRHMRRTFEAVFRVGETVTPADWSRELRQYVSELRLGRCDRTVLPERVFEYLREGEVSRYVDFTCSFCGKTGENIARTIYDENNRRRRPNLCRVCHATAMRTRKTPQPGGAVCVKCGARYALSVYDAELIRRDFREPICPDCLVRADYACQTPGCTGQKRLPKYRHDELLASGRKIRCDACLQTVALPCQAPGCENTAETPRWRRIEFAQQGRRILCREHLAGFTGRR